MLRILGRPKAACDGLTRRDLLSVGGLSLFGGVTLPSLLRAQQSGPAGHGTARSVVLLNLFGGPPHMDMFDLKPDAPENVRGELKPISTSVPGLQISELLPKTAELMDRATLIRTYSHKYNSHNPYNVLTGFDGGNDRDNYFAKVTDHPGMGSICQYLDMGAKDVPRYVMMPASPGYTQALRRAGPYGGYLGSQYDPLFTVCDPQVARESKGDYDAVVPMGYPTLPSLDAMPDITADRFATRGSLLGQLDQDLARLENNGAVSRLSEFKQQAFNLLSSSKTRNAFDITREPDSVRDEYGRNLWGSSLLVARRLVEAGSTFITVHWESKGKNHWDLHGNNFGMLKVQCPNLDQLIAAFVRDLEQRNLLDSTLFVVMGEMGRSPTINKAAGRDHWPQCGFSLMFGGGTRRGVVVGTTDKHAAYPTERPVSAGDMVATVYQLLGIDPHTTVHDLGGRPVHISHGGSPVFEAIA
ncbi:MAG: DUF1501 domain-containing protein [Planctomycetaceae bacterium]